MEPIEGAPRRELINFLLISTLSLCGGASLVAVRFALTDRFFYSFLIWNLVLALMPYGISVGIYVLARQERSRARLAWIGGLSLAWLVFYPNAPYIFTDFIHIVQKTFVRSANAVLDKETLLWFDLILVSAFACMGHLVGLISIDLVLRSLSGILRPLLARLLVGAAILLAGFGIYLGRFIRFNSWDFFLHPLTTAHVLTELLADGTALLLSFAFALFILITYAVYHLSRK